MRDGVAVVCVLALALLVAWRRFDLAIGLGDEGLLAVGAMRVLGGELPNRDFSTLHPPLSFYLVAGLFAVFSPSLRVLRRTGLGLHLAHTLLVYRVARSVGGVPAACAATLPALVTALTVHNFIPFAVWWGSVFALAAVWQITVAVSGGRARHALAAGVLTSLTFAVRQDQGFYLSLAVLAYAGALAWLAPAGTRLGARRLLAGWGAGGLAVALPLLVFWAVSGALPAMLDELVVFPLTTYAQTSSLPWPGFSSAQKFRMNVETACFYLPPLVIAPSLAVLARRLRAGTAGAGELNVWLVSALAALFYAQVFARSDLYHLVIGLAPTWVLLGWLLETASRALAVRTASPRVAPIVVFGLALAVGVGVYTQLRDRLVRPIPEDRRLVQLDRAGVYLADGPATALEEEVRFLQSAAPGDRAILVLPYEPMYYFLAERRNPTRWNYLWPGDQTPEQHRALLMQAAADPPAAVVLTGVERFSRTAPEITAWVAARYREVRRLREATFYLPRGGEPAPSIGSRVPGGLREHAGPR